MASHNALGRYHRHDLRDGHPDPFQGHGISLLPVLSRIPSMAAAYVIKLLLWSGAVLLLAAAFNYVVDPYELHRLVNLDGFNKKKPSAGPNGKLIKPYGVQLVQPRTLLLGNSRVEAGIDPESDLWPQSWRP